MITGFVNQNVREDMKKVGCLLNTEVNDPRRVRTCWRTEAWKRLNVMSERGHQSPQATEAKWECLPHLEVKGTLYFSQRANLLDSCKFKAVKYPGIPTCKPADSSWRKLDKIAA